MKSILLISFLLLSLAYTQQLRDPFNSNIPINAGAGAAAPVNDIYVFKVNNLKCKELLESLKTIYPELTATALESTNQLVFKTTAVFYKKLLISLAALDQPIDQLIIEVKVVELSDNSLGELGISWKQGLDGISISEVKDSQALVDKVSFLLASGKANILANPRIATLIGKEAIIHIGDKIPYSIPLENSSGKISWEVKYLDTGVNLLILPESLDNDFIALHLQPEASSIKQWKQTSAGEYPIISARKVNTYLKLKNKETIAIGGLLNTEARESLKKIPILGDIPIINILFRYTIQEQVKSDVVFLVTAHRLDN